MTGPEVAVYILGVMVLVLAVGVWVLWMEWRAERKQQRDHDDE